MSKADTPCNGSRPSTRRLSRGKCTIGGVGRGNKETNLELTNEGLDKMGMGMDIMEGRN
jgi:hypothetical protein